ncbi:MAG TPA: tRNA uridine-5-carboxymethylaminomethyl(34) synthesis GTPase MnmE [Ktedonobacterales bacterium]|jgi:tRNA modification GTPase|nr:tRNA uridine-5-carboxymethylaminomethyl(34) synthesis GTPase MnmE [Ktedonobacterales bacterium]
MNAENEPANSQATLPGEADDTIAAIATPPGIGGVGVIRVSGARAFAIGQTLFHPAQPLPAGAPLSHQLTYGYIVDPATGETIDETLTVFMRAPRTYTREDVVEMQGHGSPLTLRRILGLALAAGARLAHPGEMTQRAFLNGRIDLTQAEAVLDLVNASSEAGRRLALRQLDGDLSARVQAIRVDALGALTRIQASIDFPEEEVPLPDPEELHALIAGAATGIAELLKGAARGRIVREGLRVVIVGRPNVGKSSLLNTLLGMERAIVTPIAGTTRDTVEEGARLGDLALRLVDTAGLTATNDPVERLGVARSRAAAREADILIVMLDGSEPLTSLDHAAATELRDTLAQDAAPADAAPFAPVTLAINKADLPQALSDADAQALWPGAPLVRISTLTREGVAPLEEAISRLALSGEAQMADPLVASARHADALRRVGESLGDALRTLDRRDPLDFVAIDLRDALETLGEITGETATADLLDQIFAQFCIGK